MSQTSLDPHCTVFEHWRSAHSQLDQAIQEYVNTCTALETALVTPPREWTSQHLQNKSFVDLDLELPLLPLHEQKLREARLRLNSARNSSQALSPINSLPPEILTTIFALATRDWITEDYKHVGQGKVASASDIASVCCLWRRVMLHSHAFWCDLELVLNGLSSDAYYERATLWAERSQSAPLDVSVREGKVTPGPTLHRWGDSEISRAAAFLTPLMPRVRSLKIGSQERPAEKLARTLLTCWIQHGHIGTAKRLEMHINLDLPELVLPGISRNAEGSSLYPRSSKNFLSSLQVIRFENVAVHWGCPLYSGLTEIRIEFAFESSWYPTQRDVASLLAANPRLRSLILYCMRIRPHRGPTPAPVALDNLEVLGLETMNAKDLGLVLPLISSASGAIRVSLSLGDDPAYISAVRSFFARTKVTVLHADGGLPLPHPSIYSLFAHMPYLKTLILRSCRISKRVLEDLVHQRASENKSLDFWPALQELYVLHCGINPQILRQLVEIHPPRKLWLCETNLNEESVWGTVQARTATQEELSHRGVELVWPYNWRRNLASWEFVL
ncbi:hypothetical protein FS749_009033 [Ceratobasidium sp. UAMH 11750]|nr:hypothetical protein FS749_009033 [Ceratobasidium sp. UAMH 11750]